MGLLEVAEFKYGELLGPPIAQYDVIVPHTILDAVHATMSDPSCVGGGVDVDYRPQRLSIRLYLRAFLGHITGMVQGATQFCRKSVFEKIGGYDEKAWIGEDVDFYWSLKRFAKAEHRTVRFIRSPRVRPSCRRFDSWPVWRTLIWTNHLFIALFRRWKAVWRAGTRMRCGRPPYPTGGRRQAQPEVAKFRLKRTCPPSSRTPPSRLHPIAS